MKKTSKSTSIKIGIKQLEMLKQIAQKLELTQKECLEKTIEEALSVMKKKTKLKAKLHIEEMTPEEATVYTERKIEELEKTMNYIVGMIKLQEREILNPILVESKILSAKNDEIIQALKNIK